MQGSNEFLAKKKLLKKGYFTFYDDQSDQLVLMFGTHSKGAAGNK